MIRNIILSLAISLLSGSMVDLIEDPNENIDYN